MADRRFLTLRKTIIFYICIWNIFLLIGCAKTEMVSEDNTVTNENIVTTTGTIAIETEVTETEAIETETIETEAIETEKIETKKIETETQDAIQPSTDQPPEAAPEYKIIMVGDILLHTPVEESCLQPDGSYDYDSLFSHTKGEIAAADLALVNQEVIIGGADLGISGYPCFNADYNLCDSLVGAGFDVICHATNHAMDKGRAGLVNCAEYWRDEYPEITVLGIHDTADTSTSCGADPAIIELGDMRIAVLNYTYGTNGISLPADMPYAVDLLNEEQVAADIQRAEELADFTIVCPHWGTEYRLTSDASQEKWTKIFAENGADLVLGTHPHVIEPIEWVTDEENDQEMLVYYSLGNFVNWTSGTGEGVANRMVGGMAEVTLTKNEDGKVEIADYGVKPMISHVTSGPEGVTTYFLEDYDEVLAEENEIVSQDPDFSREYCVNLCDSVWGDLWKAE